MNNTKEFEALCYSVIRKEFPYFDEWLLSHRKYIGSVCNVVPWVVQRKDQIILVFCELVKNLSKERVANIALCKSSVNALRAIIFVPSFTNIDKSTLEYAKEKGIEIRKISWKD